MLVADDTLDMSPLRAVARGDRPDDDLAALERAGLVSRVGDGWELTEQGRRELTLAGPGRAETLAWLVVVAVALMAAAVAIAG